MNCAVSSCVNEPVAADLNLQKTTYWISWTLPPVRASLSSQPAATRGWYHCHVQRAPSLLNLIKYTQCISIPCVSEKSSFHSEVFVMFLFLPRVSPSLSLRLHFCVTPAARIRTQSCLKSLKSCRWVTVRRILCRVCVFSGFLIINTPLVHQGSRIDEQRCEFPLPLKVSLQSENQYAGLIPHVFLCWHWPFYERHDICFPKQQKRQGPHHHQVLLCVYFSLSF